MQKIILLLVCSIISSRGLCQFASKDYNFLAEVKQIDEFTERFNDTSNTLRKQLLKEFGKASTTTHKGMVKSLFNRQNSRVLTSDMDNFANFVCDSSLSHPLSLEDTNWYAEAKARFTYKKQKLYCTLYLHVNKYKNNGTYWMIAGIKCPPMPCDISLDNLGCAHAADSTHYIPLTFCNTYFVGLKRFLTPKMCPEFYFEPQLLASQSGQDFVNSILQNKLQFEYVDTIIYHFIYQRKWKFEVEYFSRDMNAGWLISNLSFLSEKDRNKSLRDFLAFDTSSISERDSKQIVNESKELIYNYSLFFNDAIKSFVQNSVQTHTEPDTNIFANNCRIEDNPNERTSKNTYKVYDYIKKISYLFYPSDENAITINNVTPLYMKPEEKKIVAYFQFTENYTSKMSENDNAVKYKKNKNWIAEITCYKNGSRFTCRISKIFLSKNPS